MHGNQFPDRRRRRQPSSGSSAGQAGFGLSLYGPGRVGKSPEPVVPGIPMSPGRFPSGPSPPGSRSHLHGTKGSGILFVHAPVPARPQPYLSRGTDPESYPYRQPEKWKFLVTVRTCLNCYSFSDFCNFYVGKRAESMYNGSSGPDIGTGGERPVPWTVAKG